MMIKYEDLIQNTDNEYLQEQTKVMQTKLERPLDMESEDDKWLAVTYLYALDNQLLEYQARSFASELTLFITGKLYDTDVYYVYREDWLDSYLFKRFNEMQKQYAKEEFWQSFIDYMIDFYQSKEIWKYERVSKYLHFRCSTKEREMFDSIPSQKPKQRFFYLLENYDYNIKSIEYRRYAEELDTDFSINLTPSEYYKFMSIVGDNKTDKFLNMLYYWYLKWYRNSDDNLTISD